MFSWNISIVRSTSFGHNTIRGLFPMPAYNLCLRRYICWIRSNKRIFTRSMRSASLYHQSPVLSSQNKPDQIGVLDALQPLRSLGTGDGRKSQRTFLDSVTKIGRTWEK